MFLLFHCHGASLLPWVVPITGMFWTLLLQEQAEHLIKLVEEGDFPHLLVYGPPGAGKKVNSHYSLQLMAWNENWAIFLVEDI